jgi:hypothetical protein
MRRSSAIRCVIPCWRPCETRLAAPDGVWRDVCVDIGAITSMVMASMRKLAICRSDTGGVTCDVERVPMRRPMAALEQSSRVWSMSSMRRHGARY